MKDIDPDKPFAGGLGDYIPTPEEQRSFLAALMGSPHAPGSMQERARQMQQFRLECLERSMIRRFLNMSSDYWKHDEKQN